MLLLLFFCLMQCFLDSNLGNEGCCYIIVVISAEIYSTMSIKNMVFVRISEQW